MKLPQKMRFKILILCLACTMSALILQTWLFNHESSTLIYNQAKKESLSLLQTAQDDLFTSLQTIQNNMIEIYNNRELIRALKNETNVDTMRSQYYREAYSLATDSFDTSDGVVALYLYNQSDAIISTYRRAVTPRHNYPTDIYLADADDNADIVKEYVHGDRSEMLISSYYNTHRETDILRFVMKIYNSNRNALIGYIVCDMDSDMFRSRIQKFITDENTFVWLQPLGDRVALSCGALEGKDAELFNQIAQTLSHGRKVDTLPSNGTSRVFFQVDQSKFDLTIYALTPQVLLEANQRSLTSSLLTIAALMLVVTLITTYLWSKSLTRPLEELTKTTERIKNGETNLRVTVKKCDEIGELGQSFNEMLDQIENLMFKEYETKLLLNKAEYNALQAQINPHFLYNTLDTMSSIAQMRHCDEVSRLCQSLSNLFRYSLDMKNPFSTVAGELEHLKNYIYVMDVRMRDGVAYEFDIDSSVQKDTVPRICMQPLVENALNHGLRNKRGEKKVFVRAKAEGCKMVICVEDNGVGIENADELNRQMEANDLQAVAQGNSIGLANINARVKMLYGDAYGIRVVSQPGAGTKVYLSIARLTMEEIEAWKTKPTKS